jgi:hypothetical protein
MLFIEHLAHDWLSVFRKVDGSNELYDLSIDFSANTMPDTRIIVVTAMVGVLSIVGGTV